MKVELYSKTENAFTFEQLWEKIRRYKCDGFIGTDNYAYKVRGDEVIRVNDFTVICRSTFNVAYFCNFTVQVERI